MRRENGILISHAQLFFFFIIRYKCCFDSLFLPFLARTKETKLQRRSIRFYVQGRVFSFIIQKTLGLLPRLVCATGSMKRGEKTVTPGTNNIKQ